VTDAEPTPPSRLKQVIVVNAALALPPGKLAAQVAHGSMLAFLRASPELQRAWLQSGMAKIVLTVPSHDALVEIAEEAEKAGLATGLIQDAGRTVLAPGTATCVGIGPDEAARIDPVTGTLRLLP
jgi:PTH2 family peptidyl-tRNA hydrolase